MTTLLYLLIAALAFFIIGYLLAKMGCDSGAGRYLPETPVDPVTEDDGSCEDEAILALQAEEAAAREAEAQNAAREAEEAAQREAKAKEEAEAAAQAEEEAQKAAQAEAEAQTAKEAQTAEATETSQVTEEAQQPAQSEVEAQAEQEAKEESEAATVQTETKEKASEGTEAEAEESAQTAAEEAAEGISETQSDKVTEDEAETAAPKEEVLSTTESDAPQTPQAVAPEGLLDAPRDGKKDNLTRIKGIGIKIDAALNAIGIYHFDQIAAWTEENMAWADRELAFPGRAKRDDWVGQAKLLAQGKETEFSKRVDKGEVASSKKA